MRQPALGDVEVGHDLETARERGLELRGRRHLLVKHAVDAEAHAVALLVRFDVNIGGALLNSREQNVVAQLDDGSVVRRLFQIEGVGVVFRGAADLDLLLDLVHHLLDIQLFAALVVLLDGLRDADLGGDDNFDVVAGDELEVVDGEDVGRIGDGDDQRRTGPVDRNDPMALDHLLGHEGDDVAIDVEFGQVDSRHAVLLGKKLGKIVLLDRAHFDERVPQAFARFLALFLSALKLLRRDDLVPEQ